jgi:hypothetical protein
LRSVVQLSGSTFERRERHARNGFLLEQAA